MTETPRPGPTSPGELTVLLRRWTEGDRRARDRFFDLVHPELRVLAGHRLRAERTEITLQATELVHEAFLRLESQKRVDWQSRTQFFALAATLIRRILVYHARRRARVKRGGGQIHLAIDDLGAVADRRSPLELIALDRALVDLAGIRATAARVVELKLFAGMAVDEIADALGLSRATVIRRWRFAKAWLAKRLQDDGRGPGRRSGRRKRSAE